MKTIKSFFSNLKLKNKFIAAYGLLLILPLLVTGILFDNWLSKVTQDQTKAITLQTIKQAELNIAYIKEQVENLGDMVFWDTEFREVLKEKDTILYEQVREYETIINMLMRIEENPRIYKARLYVLDNKIYANNNQNIFPIEALQGDTYFNIIMNKENRRGWTDCYTLTSFDGRNEKVISYMLVLNDFDNFGQVIGCLFIDVLEEEFYTILNEIKIGDNGFAIMNNSKGSIITSTYHSSKELDDMENIFSYYHKNKKSNLETFNNFSWEGTYFSALSTQIDDSDWEIIYIMPTHEIMGNIEASIRITLLIIIMCIILAIIIAVIVSNKITKGINELINKMEKVQGIGVEMLEGSKTEYSRDEIGQLQYHFNLMMERIRNLVKENYQVQLQRREAQLKALQAQINPHFLYNVLDSINWMAIRAGLMNISDMVTDLGQFYPIGLSRGRDVISIREELEHVKVYLKIQKIRFEQTIEVVFEIPEEILDYTIVKLTLQPIVENAIVHGILTKPTQKGIIKICGFKESNEIIIQILDDGIGVDFKKINYILSDPNSQFSKGFGIKNVNERIKLYFGSKYGVALKRVEDQWTVVEIRLPALKDIYM